MNENPEKNFHKPPENSEQTKSQESGEKLLESFEKSVSIEEVKQHLFDSRLISKKIDKEGRVEVATDIGRRRQEEGFVRGKIAERESALSEIEQQTDILDSTQADKVLELEQRLEKVLVRLKGVLSVKDKVTDELETDIRTVKEEVEALSAEASGIRTEIERLQQRQLEIPKTAELLQAYYEKMETVPLTNEEKREFLKPEVLVELSTAEYVALWRRLNPHFLSHVTRQGFRDHNAMIYHSAGLQEFHDGLVSVLKDNKILRPPMAVRDGLRSRDESTVREFLEDWALKAESEEEAKKRLNAQLNHTLATAPNYSDKTAVHFAAQIVADNYYGGEQNNEAFFLYPSDVLASQHNFAFNGWEKDFTQPQSETKWNDVFVWPDSLDNAGISVDSGLVFLPENTPVDPETGSKYASEIKIVEGEEKRVTLEDEERISVFVEWAENLNDNSPAIQAFNEYREVRFERDSEKKACYEAFRNEIIKLGFPEDVAMDIIHSLFSDALGIYHAYPQSGQLCYADSKRGAALQKLRAANANWKRAENTIPAKEYWESYFSQHPEQKPKHLIFYDGDPTTAIHEFQQKNGIGQADVSETEGKLLGFDDKHISDMREDQRARVGYDELVEMGHRMIEEHYRH